MSEEKSHYAYLNPDPNGRAPNTHRVRLDEGFIPDVIVFKGDRYVSSEWDDSYELTYYLEIPEGGFMPADEDVEEL